jgi:hypothetical protein
MSSNTERSCSARSPGWHGPGMHPVGNSNLKDKADFGP